MACINCEPKLMEPNYIDQLNNIFFEQIYSQITNLSDKVRMLRAYPQFLDTIINMWRRSGKYSIAGPNTEYLRTLNIDDYAIFMHLMRDSFTEFHVNEDGFGSFAEFNDYLSHLFDMQIFEFPNVELAVFNGNPDTMVDADYRDLALILPNLKSLQTSMNISGIHLRGFRKLEVLSFKSVYHSMPLSSCCIQEICMIMTNLRVLDITDHFDSEVRLSDIKLPKLEILKINLNTVENILDKVLELPALKKLVVRFDDSRQLNASCERIFQDIILKRSGIITGISVNADVLQLTDRWYDNIQLKLPKLRKLVCENWCGNNFFLDHPYVPIEQLEIIGFSGWDILRGMRLFEIVRDCEQLKLLHLNEFHSDISVLEKFERIRKSTYKNYDEPLRVFSDTLWSKINLKEKAKWFNNPNVQMTLDSTEFEFLEDGFEIEFE